MKFIGQTEKIENKIKNPAFKMSSKLRGGGLGVLKCVETLGKCFCEVLRFFRAFFVENAVTSEPSPSHHRSIMVPFPIEPSPGNSSVEVKGSFSRQNHKNACFYHFFCVLHLERVS